MYQIDDLMVANIFREYSDLAIKTGAVNLAQGVPEPIMDQEINKLLPTVFNKGWQYSDPHGLLSLRNNIAKLFHNDFSPDEVIITSGCTESLYLALFAASKTHGSKIAFLEPFYPYYMGLSKILELDATPIEMATRDNSMIPDWDALKLAFQDGIRIFLFNTPHNPAGYVMSQQDAIYLRNLAEQYGVFLVIDFAYQGYTYNNQENDYLKILYTDNNSALLAGSASKLLSATGLRIGWLLGNSRALEAAYALHLYMSYCLPAPVQELVAQLIAKCDKEWLQHTQNLYIKKRDNLIKALEPTGLICPKIDGGHFLLADFSNLGTKMSSREFTKVFAEKYSVMPLPVDPFYNNSQAQQIRLSFSVSLDLIEEARVRIKAVK